ncbi:hypothetical protein [Streptomyces sp. IB201691-2A2]|uniref:hypothetical protein n=1 Tax=Streptomyces sp. IB201691-2A2 TaxID=2561920 RepID=UPI00117E9641|nr:hypothetical protein [Streptomyces sp. IB201691-2A2]TRO62492.1 hypothetical protein E4K73_20945 [Streptomyces sp. IB201691-2A2]
MYFSERFQIEYAAEFDWFDPILENDTLLFVDPFLVFADTDADWHQAYGEMMEYFQSAFELLASSQLKPQHQYFKRTLSLMEFPEPSEFRLGFASKNSEGSGSGPGLAKKVVEAMSQAIRRGMVDIEHFEELGILVSGINKDRISDITCNLLKPRLIKYTQDICHTFDVPMQVRKIRHSHYDEARSRWMDAEHLVPVDPETDKPILLTPKRFLRELPTLSSDSWGDFLDTSLRDDLNIKISQVMKKDEIIALARTHPDAVRRWIQYMQERGSSAYDVDSDPMLHVNWQRLARQAVDDSPIEKKPHISNVEDLLSFAHTAIEHFRTWVEKKGGWRVFWRDVRELKAIPEPNMQLLFLGVLERYCEQAGVRLDREVETGRGPVDFTFTSAGDIRVLLEMKKLTHGEFWHGIRTQTPIYMESQDVKHAIFLAIRDSTTKPMRARWIKLDQEAAAASEANLCTIEVARIDIMPKESASNS